MRAPLAPVAGLVSWWQDVPDGEWAAVASREAPLIPLRTPKKEATAAWAASMQQMCRDAGFVGAARPPQH